ncbi:hypothetical protein QEM27_004986 [Pseudomonas putida]|nr:hypothetical protein [Pseudomonas putida]EKT8868337.1 hypothetical protein [Pseudomonas putida]
MFLKNEAARLITINHLVDGEQASYQILPGENPAVEVPDAVKKIDFVKALLDNGDLRIVDGGEEEGSDDGSDDDIDALRAEAAELGIEVSNRWGEKRLREEIAKAQPAE